MQAQEKEEQAILKVVEGARSLAELRPSALNGGNGVGMGGQMALSQIADRLAGLARQGGGTLLQSNFHAAAKCAEWRGGPAEPAKVRPSPNCRRARPRRPPGTSHADPGRSGGYGCWPPGMDAAKTQDNWLAGAGFTPVFAGVLSGERDVMPRRSQPTLPSRSVSMAIPTAVNDQITDAVTQANVKVLAESPAMAMGAIYQTMAHSTGILFENAVSAQQQQKP